MIVQNKISELELSMDLVMVAERMDESLVLLADLLCLPLYRVAALNVNARANKGVRNLCTD